MRYAALVLLVACTDTRPPITGTQSLKVDVVTPADLGTFDRRLPAGMTNVTMMLTALGPDGQPDTSYANKLAVYVEFLGTLTPYLGGTPLATVTMTGGKGTLTAKLPPTYGATTLWFDDGTDPKATYATGISPTLWFRDPFIADIETPVSETAIDAFEAAPLDSKNIDVRVSRYGAKGRLVVTSVYAQGYTVADVQCADAAGTPPCTSGDYDYVDVFSFSAPLDQSKRFISEGQVIDGFAGGVTEFDGLTEIGFPQTFSMADNPVVNKAMEPKPVKIDTSWFTTNKINFERNEAGAIEVDNGKVCPLDDDYTTFKQWKIDPAGNADPATCSGSNVINVISSGVVPTDPATLAGKTVKSLVGILRPINIGNFNVWIVYPRSAADLVP